MEEKLAGLSVSKASAHWVVPYIVVAKKRNSSRVYSGTCQED